MSHSRTLCSQPYDQRRIKHGRGNRPAPKTKLASRSKALGQPVHKKFETCTALTVDKKQISNTIAHESFLKKPHPMKQGSNTNKTKYCLFHEDYVHTIEQCQKLKDEIEYLIRKGHLKEYIHRDQFERM